MLIALWVTLCAVIFIACALLPLHELDAPMFPRPTPIWLALFVTALLGVLTGAGGVLFRRLMRRGFSAMGADAPDLNRDFVAESHVGGTVLMSGGLGNGANCLVTSCQDLVTWTVPFGFGFGLLISTHVLSSLARLAGRLRASGK